MKMKFCLLAMAGVFAMATTTRADTVNVSLGNASQSLVETGIGDNGAGRAQWFIQQGSCVAGGGSTTCTFSGTYTGTTAGYTGGTYSLVTSYQGNGPTYNTGLSAPFTGGPTPLIGISETPGSSFFNFEFLPATATITLNLDDTISGDHVIPIFTADAFVNGYSISDVGTPVCTGVSAGHCDPFDVGEVNGATFTDTVDGQASFDTGTVTTPPPPGVPEPSSLTLLGAGLAGIVALSLRKLA